MNPGELNHPAGWLTGPALRVHLPDMEDVKQQSQEKHCRSLQDSVHYEP